MCYIFLVLFIVFLEGKIKNHIELSYSDTQQRFILQKKIRIRKYHNHGAFLNILEKKKTFLHVISVLFTLFIFLCLLFTLFQKGNHLLKSGLSLLLGGAFSNTYDRLKRQYVVDYFSFCTPFAKLNRIVFNLSDFCIILGALITAICAS